MHKDSEGGLVFWISYFMVISGLATALQYAYLYVRFRPNSPMNLPWYLVLLFVVVFSSHYTAIMTGLRQSLAEKSKSGSPPRLITMTVYGVAALVGVAWLAYALAEVVYFGNPAGLPAVVFAGLPATAAYFWAKKPESFPQSA